MEATQTAEIETAVMVLPAERLKADTDTSLNLIEELRNYKWATDKDKADRIEALKAEADAKAAMEAENQRLKVEAEAKEKQMQAERLKAVTERAEMEARRQKDKADYEAAVEKDKADYQTALRAEQEVINKIQAKIKAKAEEELSAKKQADEAAERAAKEAAKAAKAPKKQKLQIWINAAQLTAPEGMAQDATVLEILARFEAFKKWAANVIEIS